MSFVIVTNFLGAQEDFCVSSLDDPGNAMLLDLERIMIPGLDPGLLLRHLDQKMS